LFSGSAQNWRKELSCGQEASREKGGGWEASGLSDKTLPSPGWKQAQATRALGERTYSDMLGPPGPGADEPGADSMTYSLAVQMFALFAGGNSNAHPNCSWRLLNRMAALGNNAFCRAGSSQKR
jgi:hypothetical protein